MMTNRSPCAALALAAVLLPGPAPAATSTPPPIVARRVVPREQARDLYSARARRLAIGYLRLRLLEMREAELDRVRAVIEGKLGVDALFSPKPIQGSTRAGGR
jgi:hypothetical protein